MRLTLDDILAFGDRVIGRKNVLYVIKYDTFQLLSLFIKKHYFKPNFMRKKNKEKYFNHFNERNKKKKI